MATPEKKNEIPTQLDIEQNHIDRAIRAVRDFQKGAATTGAVRHALDCILMEDLKVVSIATRVPLGSLENLRRGPTNLKP